MGQDMDERALTELLVDALDSSSSENAGERGKGDATLFSNLLPAKKQLSQVLLVQGIMPYRE